MTLAGVVAAHALAPEVPCVVCGALYQPWARSRGVCSRRCYDDLPDVKEKARQVWLSEPKKRRKNELRRGDYDEAERANRKRWNLRQYNLTPEEFDAMVAAQDGKCAICRHLPDGKGPAGRLNVDHDHLTGVVRGLICHVCNRGIGYFKDDPTLMERAAAYVRAHLERAVA